MLPLLTILIFLPLFGALCIGAIHHLKVEGRVPAARSIALIIMGFEFILSIYLWNLYNPQNVSMQFTEVYPWIESYGIYYTVGVDGISIHFILLTTFIVLICGIFNCHTVTTAVPERLASLLILETLLIGSFCAMDMLLFYVFFESTLLPMFFIIGAWGGVNRRYASLKFFLYSITGSLSMLIAVVFIYLNTDTTNLLELNNVLPSYPLEVQKCLWLAFFASFAIKIPMWLLHTWLPDAHVEAPTMGSVMLAGILLKLGGYGFLRFSLPMLPSASHYFATPILIISAIAVIYSSLIALMQTDMKKMIAYSSIAHMGFVTAGIFTFHQNGFQGAILQMLSHGLISAALFFCIEAIYTRTERRDIAFHHGLSHVMPRFAILFMVFTFASIGLPGTSGFIGEFLVLTALFQLNPLYAAPFAAAGAIGVAYMLWLYSRIMHGNEMSRTPFITDLNYIEHIYLWPIAVLIIALGLYPSLVTSKTQTSLNDLEQKVNILNSAPIGWEDM